MALFNGIHFNFGRGIVPRLLAVLLLAFAAAPEAQAQAVNCSDFPGGIIDGDFVTSPKNINVDQNCTIRNFPAGPNQLIANISFFTDGGNSSNGIPVLLIFDNVFHSGQMSCAVTLDHKIWFVNGASTSVREKCQNLLIPVEKIDKQNPPGDVATVGVPFTYRLAIPVLFDPEFGTVENFNGSPNDLHSIVVTDDLNATGVDLTYVSHTVTWRESGGAVPHAFSNTGGQLTFTLDPDLVIPADQQIYIDLTVILEDTPTNSIGTQFINTAKWEFGRLIGGIFYEPLPGEWGISDPITIGGPDIVLTKTGPSTLGRTLNLGEWGEFALNIQNTGTTDAWNLRIIDGLPNPATGGMCDTVPEIQSAQVFLADGVTPVPGKGPLIQDVDYSFVFTDANGGPECQFDLRMLTPATAIGAGERLIIDYRAQIDADSQDGAQLTNIAAAVNWSNGSPDNSDRVVYSRVRTQGTPGVADHEDAHTVTVDLYGYFFEKTVANLTQGISPAPTAVAGDRLRYTLRLQMIDGPLDGVMFQDDLGELNSLPVFQPGSLAIVPGSLPPGAVDNSDANSGTNGAGLIDIRNISVPASSEVSIQFDVTLAPSLPDGTVVTNQADLLDPAGTKLVDSDDPTVNGQSSPSVFGDEDPTVVLIEASPAGALAKAVTQPTATIGETFSYQVTVPAVAHTAPIYDVRILDDLAASAADLEFVSVTKVSGSGAWTPQNTGDATSLVIEDPVNGIDIPAGEQAVVEITVRLLDTATNVAGLSFTNTASYTYNIIDGDVVTERPGDPGTSGPMTVVEPELTLEKGGPVNMTAGGPGSFSLNVHNIGDSPAWNVTITDELPNETNGGMCDAAPVNLVAQLYEADGVTPVGAPLVDGADFQATFNGDPACTFTLEMLNPAAAIGPDQRLIVTYDTFLDADTQLNAALTNVAGATEWFSLDVSDANNTPYARTYTRVITDGTVGVLDHEDAHTVIEFTPPLFIFEKTAVNVTTGEDPATVATPGDTIRYTLRVEHAGGTPISGFSIVDELGALNANPAFQPGTLNVTRLPAGATDNSDPNGGSDGTGLLDVSGLDLNGLGDSFSIEFEVQLAPIIANGTYVLNQSQMTYFGNSIAISDDPNVNGPASPTIAGDEDRTQILIQSALPLALAKAVTQPTATIGETFSYQVTVPAVAHTAPIYDVRVLDDLAASAADLEFVSVSKVSGSGAWTPQNTGDVTSLVIEDPVNGIDIPAGEQVVIEITVRLQDTATNIAGLTFANTASYTYNIIDGDVITERPGDPGTSGPMTVVEPELTLEKGGPVNMTAGDPGSFSLNVHNIGDSPAWNLTIEDQLPNQADGGMCDAAPVNLVAQLYEADGVTPIGAVLVDGADFQTTFNGDPNCTFTLAMQTPAASIGPDQRLIVTYDTVLDADTQLNAALTNIAGATEWFSLDVSDSNNVPYARTYTRVITDGTVGVLDHEDAHTVIEFTPLLNFEKTAINVTSGEDPATVATPGDTIRYTLRVENAGGSDISDFSIVDELDTLNANPAFQPGTLTVTTLPAGATDNSDPTGGTAGTGLLDIGNLNIGGPGEVLLIEFEVQLAPVIANGGYVLNQSQALFGGTPLAISDDPNVNGPADPNVADDEDPTQILIQSAPVFDIDKISTYLEGDPNVLLAGEALRYTITVQNIGTDNASEVSIVDLIPANTTYVAGSTTLNGNALADNAAGTSALTDGILISAPQDTTPGVMNAAVANNVATITFDVVVYPDAPDGTVLSNQAFLSSPPYGIADQPSDDPRTAVPDDPTRDVVGNFPLLFAPKTAALQIDNGTPGIVDPGDTLRYTIQVYNNGTVPATIARLADLVPNDVTYVPDTTTLNGQPVGQPDGGVFPLVDRIDISSSDLPPPGAAEGVLNPGESGVVQFDMQVNAGVPTGTQIVNQATVYTDELPNLLTDGDGNPATGPEPTVVVVGDAQTLSIIKSVTTIDGGPAVAGATLDYTVTVRNVGNVPALYVTITDDLDAINPGYLEYVDGSATLNGVAAGVTFAGTTITADYFNFYGPLDPGETVTLSFRAVINSNLVDGTTVVNEAEVGWNDPLQYESASVAIDVGGVPGAGILSGSVWHDADFTNTLEPGERVLEGWTVTLLRGGQPIRSMLTDADGNYGMQSVIPNYTSGEPYSLVFSAPGAGARTALLGETDSDFTDGLQRIDDIVVQGGSNLRDLNLPIDPNGIVYDSVRRTPVPNAVVSLVDARSGAALPASCFDDAAQQDQVTLADGYYKFDINFSDPACAGGTRYAIRVTPPGSGYTAGVSAFIPPTSGETTAAFDVPACPGSANDAIPGTAQHCEAAPSELAPPASVAAQSAGTVYHTHLRLDGTRQPGSAQIFNNHIPVDPRLDGAIAITKTTSMVNVSRGQMVPYTITVTNSFNADLSDVTIVDRFPPGFRYVEGSARIDGVKTEPALVGRELHWPGQTLATDGRHELKLLMAVGAGVSEGEFTNRAQAMSALTGGVLSEEATATVRLVPDPTFDCTDVTGKVFDDANRNGYQDGAEEGIGGVRVVTARGLAAKTDSYGRYHITCAITPNEARGSNFVLKLDDRTLPSGFRASTRPVQVQRATRGKALKINFGASIHRVVGLDIADAVFEPGTTEMRPQWRPRIELLLTELKKAPSVLRLSYVADVEEESLVNRRLDSLKGDIVTAWEEMDCCYELVIEPEIFWRLGAPPDQAREAGQ
jgi:uncharacterized repeat protein (TIGR01451 family)/fimbrial isopeptide formation D2 family protein